MNIKIYKDTVITKDFDSITLKKYLSDALGLLICDISGANQYYYKSDENYSVTSIKKTQNELLNALVAFIEQECYDYLYDYDVNTISVKTLKKIVLKVLREWDKKNKTNYYDRYAKYLYNKEFSSIETVNVAEG